MEKRNFLLVDNHALLWEVRTTSNGSNVLKNVRMQNTTSLFFTSLIPSVVANYNYIPSPCESCGFRTPTFATVD